MDFRKLSPNGDATSVSLPKGELEDLGIVSESGDIQEDTWARVVHEGDGEFHVSVVGVDDG